MFYLMIILSVIILFLGLIMLFCPKWILKRMRKEENCTEKLPDADSMIMKRIRIQGIFHI